LNGKDLSSEEEWQHAHDSVLAPYPFWHSGIRTDSHDGACRPNRERKKNLPALTISLTAWPLLSKTRINQLKPNQ
jgi:hypothetical protein